MKLEREAAERAAVPTALTESERTELRRLRKEVADLKMDRETSGRQPPISPRRRYGEPGHPFRFVCDHVDQYPVKRALFLRRGLPLRLLLLGLAPAF